MKIIVTQDDIKTGNSRCAHLCPIALAATRAFSAPIAWVFFGAKPKEETAFLEVGTRGQAKHKSFILPQLAADFIHRFDCHKPVQPFDFELPREK